MKICSLTEEQLLTAVELEMNMKDHLDRFKNTRELLQELRFQDVLEKEETRKQNAGLFTDGN